MKKILALLMAITLLFTLSACTVGKPKDSSEPASAKDYEKPEGYVTALFIKINPEFTLYLDENNKVLDIDFMNDDARSLKDSIVFEGKDYKSVIKSIIFEANEAGFIKENAKIKLEALEATATDTADILDAAKSAVGEIATELKITLSVETTDTVGGQSEGTTSAADTSEDTQAEDSTGTTVSSTHVHKYSNPTCTQPATCECGATNAKVYGHVWLDATCKAPKTCKYCKAQYGDFGDHQIKDGACTVCGTTLYADITTMSQTDNYIGNYTVSGDELLGYGVNIGGNINDPELVVGLIVRFFSAVQTDPEQTPIIFNGKKYYSEGEGANPCSAQIIDNQLVVSDYGDTVKFALQKDGYLVVTESDAGNYPVGMLLSSNTSDFLTK